MIPVKLRNQEEQLRRLEGLQTVETAAAALGYSRQAALNWLSRMKKQYYVTVSGGGKRKRLYKVSQRKQLPRVPGMWDILNKYNPNFQLHPWYDHQVHGRYTMEDVIIDAIHKRSFRIALATLRLFAHVKDWPYLRKAAKEKNCWQEVGALYDVARMFIRVKRMPERYREGRYSSWKFLSQLHKKNFPNISQLWKVFIPFNHNDIREVLP